MSAAEPLLGAWYGDPARKQASIAAARAALARDPAVTCDPTLSLGAPGHANAFSNVYCAAFGTADPAELEARAGLPASTLRLASAALLGCEYWERDPQGVPHAPRMCAGAEGAPLAALEAIPPGAHPMELARRYVVALLGAVAELHDRDGQGLAPERQALIYQLAALHEEGCADAAAFRALRYTSMRATDVATGDFAITALTFVESAAWPLASLAAELPLTTCRLHFELRVQTAPERPSPTEQATLESLWALHRAVDERPRVEPTLDRKAELARIEATPEYAAVYNPSFQARLVHYDRVAAEAYAPFALDLLLRAFRMA
jgi:hypothetical protein